MSEIQTLSTRSRAMLKLADKEADELGHRFVEPEHLLLVLMQADGIPALVLSKLGAEYAHTRKWVTNARMEKRNMVGSALQGASVRTRAVLKTAGEEAKSMGKDAIDPEHILLGLLGEASTRENLQRVFNIDADNLRAEVYVALGLSAPARRYKSASTASHAASPISEPEPVKRNFFSNIPGVKEIPHPVDVDLGLERRIAPTGFSLKPIYIFLLLLLLIGFAFGFNRHIGTITSIGLGLLGLMFMAWYFGRRR